MPAVLDHLLTCELSLAADPEELLILNSSVLMGLHTCAADAFDQRSGYANSFLLSSANITTMDALPASLSSAVDGDTALGCARWAPTASRARGLHTNRF